MSKNKELNAEVYHKVKKLIKLTQEDDRKIIQLKKRIGELEERCHYLSNILYEKTGELH